MPGGDPCDAACQKIIIDTGMGIEAAKLYAETVRGYESDSLSIRAIHYTAPMFYAGVVGLIRAVALDMNRGHLTKEQRERLMTQIDEECYRADKLIAWSRSDGGSIAGHADDWTDQVFEWAKQDQTFYTEFAAEVGESGKSATTKAHSK